MINNKSITKINPEFTKSAFKNIEKYVASLNENSKNIEKYVASLNENYKNIDNRIASLSEKLTRLDDKFQKAVAGNEIFMKPVKKPSTKGRHATPGHKTYKKHDTWYKKFDTWDGVNKQARINKNYSKNLYNKVKDW